MSELENKKRFYEKTWFCILMFILICPVGLFLVWRNKMFNKVARIMLSLLAVPITFMGLIIWMAIINPKSNIEKSQKSIEIRNEQAKSNENDKTDSEPKKEEVKGKDEEKKQEINSENKQESKESATYELYKNFMESERMYIENILRNPEKFAGKNIFYYGEVTQVIDSDDNKSCVVVVKDELSDKRAGLVYERNGQQRFLEGDNIFVVGKFRELKSLELLSGASETMPVIDVKNIDILDKALKSIVAYKSINDKNIRLYSTEKQIQTEKGRVGTIYKVENVPQNCKSNYICSDGSYVYWYYNESGKLGESYYFSPQAWE